MSSSFEIPVFATEAEEADWWYENRDLVEQEFSKAFAEGRVHSGKLIPPSQRNEMFQLDPDDAKKASVQASKLGIDYQTYLKKIIHEALEKNAASETAEAA